MVVWRIVADRTMPNGEFGRRNISGCDAVMLIIVSAAEFVSVRLPHTHRNPLTHRVDAPMP